VKSISTRWFVQVSIYGTFRRKTNTV